MIIKENINGIYHEREATPEEIAAMNEMPPEPLPTEEERIAALEAAILELGGLSQMVKFYILQIRLGKIALNDVPVRWRENVKKELEKR